MSAAASLDNLARPLIEACSEGRVKDVNTLLSSGADPNVSVEEAGRMGVRVVYPLTATYRIVLRDDTLPKVARLQAERIMGILIDAGAQIRPVERELFIHAVRMGLVGILKFLIGKGGRVHRYGHELMEMAILHQRHDCMDELCAAGVDPNVRDHWGSTTFLDICSGTLTFSMGDKEQFASSPEAWFKDRFLLLFKRGVNINVKDRVGATPLIRAVVGGQDAIVRALLDSGADVNAVMPNGVCALHLAAALGSKEMVQQLISHGASLHQLARFNAKRLQPDIKAYFATLSRATMSPDIAEAKAA